MKKHWLFTTLIALALCVVCLALFPTEAKAADVSDLTFQLYGDSYKVSDCVETASGELVIPDTYNGKPVIAIGGDAFKDCCNLTNVVIPDSVTDIGEGAFSGCSGLKSITTPVVQFFEEKYGLYEDTEYKYPFGYIFGTKKYDGSIKITQQYYINTGYDYGERWWEDITYYFPESLKSVTITKDVGDYAFYNCSTLTEVILLDQISSIEDCAFCNCDGLTEITIPSNVLSIDYSTFADCDSLMKVTISEGVQYIYGGAFSGCDSLTEVTLPDSLIYIAGNPFSECKNLKGIWVSKQHPKYSNDDAGVLYSKYKSELYCVPGGLSGNYTIPDSVTKICDEAFSGCVNLKSVVIPKSVTIMRDSEWGVGNCALESCTSLTDVYYAGQASQWEQIKGRALPETANIHFNWNCDNGHTWDTGSVTKKATCKATGVKTYACCVCSKTKTEKIEKKAHSYIAATCTKPKTCKVCGATSGENLGHTYKTASANKATLSKNGSIVKKCTVCSVEKRTTIKSVKTIKLSATSYTYDGKVKTPTVTVKDSAGKTLVKGTDYDVTYASGRKALGTYKVTVKLKGNYSGTKTLTFKIGLVTPTVKTATVSNGVKVSWNKVSGAKTYIVYRSTYSNGKWSAWKAVKTGVTGTSYTDKSVKSGTTVKYTVRAVNGSVLSAYKASGSIKFLTAPTVKATTTTGGVKVSWNKIGGAKTYTVYRSTYSGGKWSAWKAVKTGATGTTYTDKTVKSGAKVKYMVKAVNGKITSSYKASSAVKFEAQPTVKVAKTASGIKATWSKISGATGYYVYRRTYANGKWGAWEKIKTTTALNYTDKTAKKGATYQYTVQAYTSYKNSNSIKW